MGENASTSPTTSRKETKIATPPKRGMGEVCTSRLRGGLVRHLRASARLRTYLVATNEVASASRKVTQ
jgi:hypothetical protein